MAQPYGYTSPSAGYYQPPRQQQKQNPLRSLSLAAAGQVSQSNPFGLNSLQTHSSDAGGRSTFQPVVPTTPSPSQTAPDESAGPKPPGGVPQTPQNTAPTTGGYDLNMDPALQAVTALTGLSDEQAQADAEKQRQLLIQAFNQNVNDLGVQRGRNLDVFTDQSNKANLTYGGHRVKGEQQLGQDYQSALSKAALQEQGGLDSIASNLASALFQNELARARGAAGVSGPTAPPAVQGGGAANDLSGWGPVGAPEQIGNALWYLGGAARPRGGGYV